jgi:hypothetical protein
VVAPKETSLPERAPVPDPVYILAPLPTTEPCQQQKHKKRRVKRAGNGKAGLSQRMPAKGQGQRVRRCKRS